MQHERRVALVTGGTRGIGFAIRQALTASGCEVYFTGRSTDPQPVFSGHEHYLPLELLAPASYQTVVDEISSRHEALDVLVNNAGTNIVEPLVELDDSHWSEILEINLTGPMRLTRALLPWLRRSASPRVLNVSSIWGVVSKEGRSAYASAKTGLVGLTRTLAIELGPEGILVNALCPGFTNTELTSRSLTEAARQQLEESVPLSRFAEPDEIARVAAFLCSTSNSYLTGQAIVVDGGFTIR